MKSLTQTHVYIHTCMHTHIYIHARIHTRNIHTCFHMRSAAYIPRLLCFYMYLHAFLSVPACHHVSVCVFVCVFVCVCVCVCVYLRVCVHVSLCACVLVCLCACVLVCLYICVCLCVYIYTHTNSMSSAGIRTGYTCIYARRRTMTALLRIRIEAHACAHICTRTNTSYVEHSTLFVEALYVWVYECMRVRFIRIYTYIHIAYIHLICIVYA